MKTITLAGPYPSEVKGLLKKSLKDDFTIREVKTQQELEAATDLEYVILRTLHMKQRIIDTNPKLEFIQRWGAGFDTVDIETAGKRNIPVAITAGVNSGAVAELALLQILSLYRNIIPLHNNTSGGVWDRNTYTSRSYMVNGKLVGLIGAGHIGRLVAKKVQSLGAKVQYYDIRRMALEEESSLDIRYCEFEELLRTSDIISLHIPLTDQTKNLIALPQLKMMKPTSILINTARGGIINEKDLARALQENIILGAALDCFETEPFDTSSDLARLNNVVLTPHVGGSVSDLTPHMVRRVAENILRIHRNEPLSEVEFVNAHLCRYPK